MAYEENRLAELAKRKTSRIYTDIDMSFAMNPISRDVVKKVDVNAVKQALSSLLHTKPYERPFQPNLGSPLEDLLFEPMDENVASNMAILLEEVIKNYERRVRLDDVIVYPDYDAQEYKIQINFHVIGIRDPQVFAGVLRRLR